MNTCKATTIYSDVAHKSFFTTTYLFALQKKSFMVSSGFLYGFKEKGFQDYALLEGLHDCVEETRVHLD